nr:glycosyltransferase [Acinetobacter sp. Marseille-Q1620]
MKVAFILPSLRNLGPIIVVYDLINILIRKKNISITVFYFDTIDESALKFGVECIQLKLQKKYDFSDYDIIHSHGIRPDLYTKIYSYQNKLISTQHNIIFNEYIINNSLLKTKIIEKIWKFALSNKDLIVSIGDSAYQYYSLLLSNKNIANIPNGRTIKSNIDNIPDEDLNIIKAFKENYICLGTCTRALKLKGHAQIIKALKCLPDFCFILIGDGNYLDYLKSLAIEMEVEGRCLFLGYRKNAIDYLKLFDLYTQTSYTESISIALLEAAAAKKAIVCSDIPSNKDVFNDSEVVFFELDNISSLVNALKIASEKKDILQNNVYQKYTMQYTSEIMAERYYNLYIGLVNED